MVIKLRAPVDGCISIRLARNLQASRTRTSYALITKCCNFLSRAFGLSWDAFPRPSYRFEKPSHFRIDSPCSRITLQFVKFNKLLTVVEASFA